MQFRTEDWAELRVRVEVVSLDGERAKILRRAGPQGGHAETFWVPLSALRHTVSMPCSTCGAFKPDGDGTAGACETLTRREGKPHRELATFTECVWHSLGAVAVESEPERVRAAWDHGPAVKPPEPVRAPCCAECRHFHPMSETCRNPLVAAGPSRMVAMRPDDGAMCAHSILKPPPELELDNGDTPLETPHRRTAGRA